MEEYIERMIQEKRELDEKIVKLVAFRYSEKASVLDERQAQLMDYQFNAMREYSNALDRRLQYEKAIAEIARAGSQTQDRPIGGKYDDEKCQTCAGNLGCC